MARRYDSRTTIFSPEGRLHQVEYALEAINHASTAVGISAVDGVVLAAERKVNSPLLEPVFSDKMFKIDHHIACAVAGITSDGNTLVNEARLTAQRHRLSYESPMPVEHAVRRLCDTKHVYTQYGGQRPFGVSFLWAGWDDYHGFQLYQSDPSGNYGGWRASAIGANNGPAVALLKQEWKDDLNVEGALQLSLKTLCKTMDAATLTSEKVELATLTLDANARGGVSFHVLSKDEVDAVIAKSEFAPEPKPDME
jgi:20S proteasome subunit alpha 3